MPKQLKKIKVKKPKKPRQPRRAGVPRKPPVTNISVTIAGGSTQPSGSYYFPDAQQQPLNSNVFTQAPAQTFRPRVLEEPVDFIPPPIREVVEMATQTAPVRPRLRVVADTGSQTTSLIRMNTGSQTQASVPSNILPLLPPLPAATGAVAGGSSRRGRPVNEFTTSNKSLAQLREMAGTLGIDSTEKSLKLLKSEIDYLRRKNDK